MLRLVDPIDACTELMAHLSMVSTFRFCTLIFMRIFFLANIMQALVWAPKVTDHVKTLQSRVEASDALEARAVKAEQDLKTARELVQIMSDQAEVITSERNLLKEDVGYLWRKITQRNTQLQMSGKEL